MTLVLFSPSSSPALLSFHSPMPLMPLYLLFPFLRLNLTSFRMFHASILLTFSFLLLLCFLTCMSVFLYFPCSPWNMPCLSWTWRTLKEKVWSLSEKNYKVVEEKKMALYETWKMKANRDLVSPPPSIFFPCTILGVRYVFPTKYGQERLWHSAASFPGIMGGLSVTSEVGLKFPSFFPFMLKEIYL